MAKLTASSALEIVRRAGFTSLDTAIAALKMLTPEQIENNPALKAMCDRRDLIEAELNTASFGQSTKKQPTRLMKVECLENAGGCGYVMRVTRVWLDRGVPVCPNRDCKLCGNEMSFETDATTADNRVNEYHTQQTNSLKKIITAETGKQFTDSVRERGTYRGKQHTQAYNKPETVNDADDAFAHLPGASDLSVMDGMGKRNAKMFAAKRKGKK